MKRDQNAEIAGSVKRDSRRTAAECPIFNVVIRRLEAATVVRTFRAMATFQLML